MRKGKVRKLRDQRLNEVMADAQLLRSETQSLIARARAILADAEERQAADEYFKEREKAKPKKRG
jgi:hypothetical protein